MRDPNNPSFGMTSTNTICYHGSPREVPHISPETPAVPPKALGLREHAGVEGDICGTTREEAL